MNDRIDAAFRTEWMAAVAARRAGDHATAMRRLERAHILGQHRTGLHVRSHMGMLALAWQRGDRREIVGQLLRIVAAALFSRIWVPTGNTGGADVSAFRRMPVPEDLREALTRTREP